MMVNCYVLCSHQRNETYSMLTFASSSWKYRERRPHILSFLLLFQEALRIAPLISTSLNERRTSSLRRTFERTYVFLLLSGSNKSISFSIWEYEYHKYLQFSIICITYSYSSSMIWLRPIFSKISSQMAIVIDLKSPGRCILVFNQERAPISVTSHREDLNNIAGKIVQHGVLR